MRSLLISSFTRVLGKAQGFIGLAVRDVIVVHEDGPYEMMETAWEPLPDELERLNAGAPVILQVLGTAHPAVKIIVGEAP